jgi:hypothetical protein
MRAPDGSRGALHGIEKRLPWPGLLAARRADVALRTHDGAKIRLYGWSESHKSHCLVLSPAPTIDVSSIARNGSVVAS